MAIQYVEVRDAAKHHTMHRTDTHNKECLVQNVSSANIENLWSSEYIFFPSLSRRKTKQFIFNGMGENIHLQSCPRAVLLFPSTVII